jgi:hypothetical protein
LLIGSFFSCLLAWGDILSVDTSVGYAQLRPTSPGGELISRAAIVAPPSRRLSAGIMIAVVVGEGAFGRAGRDAGAILCQTWN